MNSTNQLMQLLIPVLKPREGRVAPARCVRLMQTQHGVVLYNEDRWGGLPPRIANAIHALKINRNSPSASGP
jgi:hypothetical protein